MHPVVCQLVSDYFYNGKLESATSLESRTLALAYPHYDPNFPILVVDFTSQETLGGIDSMSITNEEQVRFLTVFGLVASIFDGSRFNFKLNCLVHRVGVDHSRYPSEFGTWRHGVCALCVSPTSPGL